MTNVIELAPFRERAKERKERFITFKKQVHLRKGSIVCWQNERLRLPCDIQVYLAPTREAGVEGYEAQTFANDSYGYGATEEEAMYQFLVEVFPNNVLSLTK